MEKTTYYQLNKPEAADPLRVADFNENSDIIDAALGAAGNCKITCGTYTGTGTYGSANPCTLNFDFTPKVVFVYQTPYYFSPTRYYSNTNYWSEYNQIFYCAATTLYVLVSGNLSGITTYALENNALTWYNGKSAEHQMNEEGTRYAYVALG